MKTKSCLGYAYAALADVETALKLTDIIRGALTECEQTLNKAIRDDHTVFSCPPTKTVELSKDDFNNLFYCAKKAIEYSDFGFVLDGFTWLKDNLDAQEETPTEA